ncbi:hypothetical protein K470DRAFT_288071, partial [Piedraia hortae CBS 480.64]
MDLYAGEASDYRFSAIAAASTNNVPRRPAKMASLPDPYETEPDIEREKLMYALYGGGSEEEEGHKTRSEGSKKTDSSAVTKQRKKLNKSSMPPKTTFELDPCRPSFLLVRPVDNYGYLPDGSYFEINPPTDEKATKTPFWQHAAEKHAAGAYEALSEATIQSHIIENSGILDTKDAIKQRDAFDHREGPAMINIFETQCVLRRWPTSASWQLTKGGKTGLMQQTHSRFINAQRVHSLQS